MILFRQSKPRDSFVPITPVTPDENQQKHTSIKQGQRWDDSLLLLTLLFFFHWCFIALWYKSGLSWFLRFVTALC